MREAFSVSNDLNPKKGVVCSASLVPYSIDLVALREDVFSNIVTSLVSQNGLLTDYVQILVVRGGLEEFPGW